MSLSDFQCFSSQRLTTPGGMSWRGTWGFPGVYQYGDVVEGPDGEGYVCIDLDGTSGQTPGATPAVWQLLSSGTATATSLTAANGSGITVAEPTTNNFTVATNLVAGSGISLTPSGINTSLTVGNSGVLSVSAGTGISVGGTAQAPSVTNTGVTSLTTAPGSGLSVDFTTGGIQINKVYPSQTQLVDTRLTGGPALSAVSPGGVTTLITNIPVVAGGVYTLTAVLSVASSSSNPANQMFITIAPVSGGLPVGQSYDLFSDTESTLQLESGNAVPFTVPAGVTQYGVFVGAFGAGGFGNISGALFSAYLTRWS